jgi:hypothetical protein
MPFCILIVSIVIMRALELFRFVLNYPAPKQSKIEKQSVKEILGKNLTPGIRIILWNIHSNPAEIHYVIK